MFPKSHYKQSGDPLQKHLYALAFNLVFCCYSYRLNLSSWEDDPFHKLRINNCCSSHLHHFRGVRHSQVWFLVLNKKKNHNLCLLQPISIIFIPQESLPLLFSSSTSSSTTACYRTTGWAIVAKMYFRVFDFANLPPMVQYLRKWKHTCIWIILLAMVVFQCMEATVGRLPYTNTRCTSPHHITLGCSAHRLTVLWLF